MEHARRAEATSVRCIPRLQDVEGIDEHLLIAFRQVDRTEHQGQQDGLLQGEGTELVVDLRGKRDELLDGEELSRGMLVDHQSRISGTLRGRQREWLEA